MFPFHGNTAIAKHRPCPIHPADRFCSEFEAPRISIPLCSTQLTLRFSNEKRRLTAVKRDRKYTQYMSTFHLQPEPLIFPIGLVETEF